MKSVVTLFSLFLFSLLGARPASAHCEIPCGIYGDSLRFDLLAEHIDTLEKSTKQILALSKKKRSPVEDNQLSRWVANKEAHAGKIQQIVSQYFLHQRIKSLAKGKPGYERYITQLTLAHRLLVGAMKAKQGVDLKQLASLRTDLSALRKAYLGKG
jgi:nickel superoxide dismutase